MWNVYFGVCITWAGNHAALDNANVIVVWLGIGRDWIPLSASNGDITPIIIDKLCAEFEITINHVYRKVSLDCAAKMAIVTVAKLIMNATHTRYVYLIIVQLFPGRCFHVQVIDATSSTAHNNDNLTAKTLSRKNYVRLAATPCYRRLVIQIKIMVKHLFIVIGILINLGQRA